MKVLFAKSKLIKLGDIGISNLPTGNEFPANLENKIHKIKNYSNSFFNDKYLK